MRFISRWTTIQGAASGGVIAPAGIVLSTVKKVSNSSALTCTLTNFLVPVSGGPYTIVVAWESNVSSVSSVTGVTWNSRSFTLGAARSHADAIIRTEMWYLTTADLGVTSNIVVTFSPTADVTAMIAYCIEGVKMQAPEATATSSATSEPISTSITTLTDGALIVDAAGASGTTTTPTTTAAGQTAIDHQANTADGLHCSYRVGGAAGSHAMGWDYTVAVARNPHVLLSFEKA